MCICRVGTGRNHLRARAERTSALCARRQDWSVWERCGLDPVHAGCRRLGLAVRRPRHIALILRMITFSTEEAIQRNLCDVSWYDQRHGRASTVKDVYRSVTYQEYTEVCLNELRKPSNVYCCFTRITIDYVLDNNTKDRNAHFYELL